MKFEEALTLLKPITQNLHTEFNVAGLYIFGSVARGEEATSSDIDILMDFKDTPTFAGFMDLKFFLEEKLNTPVDLVTRNALRPCLKNQIEKEARPIA